MFLKSCEIENFRSIKSLNIEIDNKFQVLVGLNEAGKSNILKALSMLDPSILPTDDDIRDIAHEENPVTTAYIRFIFSLEKFDTKEIFNSVKTFFQAKNLNQELLKRNKISHSLQDFCDFKKIGFYETNLIKKVKRFSHYSIKSQNFTVSDTWKKVPVSWKGYEKFTSKTFKYISIADYPEHKDDSTLESIDPEDLNTFLGGYVCNYIEENLFECVVWKYNEKNLLPSRIDTASFKADPNTCEPLRNIFYLSGYFDITKRLNDAAAKTNGMKNILRKVSENATAHLRKVWPEYKNISIDLTENGSHIEAGIQDEFNFYSFSRRSDGFKRFITFLLMISAKVKADFLNNTVIIIDEPDIGLHPSGVQYLREELKKISKNNIVFASSHSIFMIDKDRVDTNLIIKKIKEETTVTSNYSSNMLDEEVIYRAMGYSLFEILKSKNVVFEGWSDKHTFKVWLASNQVNPIMKAKWKKIGLIHAFGVKDVQRVAGQLEDFEREYFVLSDADKPSLEWQKKFEGKGKWYTYKDLGFADKETIEDFISENFTVDHILSVLKKEQLNSGIAFTNNSTFNSKLEYIKNTIPLNKDEFERIKKLIKNSIFESLKSDKLELIDLFNVINDKF